MTLRTKAGVLRRAGGSATRATALYARAARRHDWWRGTAWEHVRAAGLFDAQWYHQVNADVARSRRDPFLHFVAHGAAQGRDPNPLFDSRWYLDTYPDVAAAGVVPVVHYLEAGAAEGRDPGPGFSTAYYLQENADVRAARVNPLAHFLTCGLREGRRPVPLARNGLRRTLSIVVVSGEPGTPGHEYRAVRLADAVRRLGHRTTVLTLPDAVGASAAHIAAAAVIVLWRTVWGPEVEAVIGRARRAGAVVVFDVDDLMVDSDAAVVEVVDGIRSQGLTEDEAQDWFAAMRRTAEAADAALCTTEALAAHLRRLGRPTWILPNGYDEAALTRSRLAVRTRAAVLHDGLVRIGYASGSLTHQRDFALAAPAVASALRADPARRLVLFRGALQLDEFPEFDDLRAQVEWRDLVPLQDLPGELARLDIALAPLEVGNVFCEAKSPIKALEAALVDVPTVASPTEAFRGIITPGVTGLLADTPSEWESSLNALLDDPPLRRSMGRAAHAAVRRRLGPGDRVQTVAAVLDQLLDDRQPAASAFELQLGRRRRPQPPAPAAAEADVVFCADRLSTARVTVVVTVHDYAHYLPAALESVRAQTLTVLDLVVVDDASSDDSREVAERWLHEHATRFNRVLLLAIRQNAGLARARNVGFDAAETPTVMVLDADNMLMPSCCQDLLDALDDSGAAYAYPRIQHTGSTSALLRNDDVRGYLPYVPQRLVLSNWIDAMALVRKDAWLAAGGYREGVLGWEDYDMWCRLAELGLHGRHVASDLALYRVHAASMLHTQTHAGERLAEVRARITAEHPWLRLEDEPAGVPTTTGHVARPVPYVRERTPTGGASAPSSGGPSGLLSDRARSLLPLLRCPVTGEQLTQAGRGGVVTAVSGRSWPVVDGRPVLAPGLTVPHVASPQHAGNPLPQRARDLLAQTPGWALHLSGGGTAAGEDRVVELDAGLYGPTDIVGDVHCLPFPDDSFGLVLALNAFEHYRDPVLAAREIHRVLKPGGLLFLHTAFLQPVHEAPHHYFNCTRHGLEQWMRDFDPVDLTVSANFHPGFALSWLTSDVEHEVAAQLSPDAARLLRDASLGDLCDLWRDPSTRAGDPRWEALDALTGSGRERLAAGFEYIGRVPHVHEDRFG